MPRCIARVDYDGKAYYMLYSTVVEAPVTYGMELPEFLEFMKGEYGRRGWSDLQESLDRANEFGCSFDYPKGMSFDELILTNQAGDGSVKLSKEEIIQKYIVSRPLIEVET